MEAVMLHPNMETFKARGRTNEEFDSWSFLKHYQSLLIRHVPMSLPK